MLFRSRYRHVYQEADNFAAFEPYVKWNATVDAAMRIPDMVRQAFRVATTGRPGPVHLQFQGFEGQVDAEEADLDCAAETAFARVPPFRPQPPSELVREALARIAAAEPPVIVAGGRCRASGAGSALRAFAEMAGVPVATSLNGRDSIPNTHPLSVGVVGSYSRASANSVVAEADLVIFAGSTAGSMTTHFWTLPKAGTKVIQIDIDPAVIGRNYAGTFGIHADAKATFDALLSAAKDAALPRRNAWLGRAAEICRAWSRLTTVRLPSGSQAASEAASSSSSATRPSRSPTCSARRPAVPCRRVSSPPASSTPSRCSASSSVRF